MKILVVRFRQIGDAILTTCVFNTIRRTFPDAETYFVLNDNIAPLFKGHDAIDNIITFSKEERHSMVRYVRKVWRVVHENRFDAIIDMRSTMNTMLFALLSPRTKYRIGIRKAYTRLAFNHLITPCHKGESIISRNLRILQPLGGIKPLVIDRRFTLNITAEERDGFRRYMEDKGIDFSRPVMLAGVTAKLADKTWNEDNMICVLDRFISRYPDVQIVFNYAPGAEEDNARRMYGRLADNGNVFVDIRADSLRKLVAMSQLADFYFGNEGGARHIVHACGKPSFVICSPIADKATWLPQDDVPSKGIEAGDIVPADRLEGMTGEQKYGVITADIVTERLFAMCDGYFKK